MSPRARLVTTGSAVRSVFCAYGVGCLVIAVLTSISACKDDAVVTREQASSEHPSAVRCTVADEGCPCAGQEPARSCRPDVLPEPNSGEPELCYEGTRHCRDGTWSACESVRGFPKPTRVATSALVDQVSPHAQCSECDPMCFIVGDNLDPADGALTAAVSSGVQYVPNSSGLQLAPTAGSLPPVPGGTLPLGALTITLPPGGVVTKQATGMYRPEQSDVYLLMDQSTSMAEETLWLYDTWSLGGPLTSASLPCAGNDSSLHMLGIWGELTCMFDDTQMGIGMFRDIPFAPYSADMSLPTAQRGTNAKQEIAFRHLQNVAAASGLVSTAIENFGGVESSGNPDIAGSQIVALHAIATGQGVDAGLGRVSVPDATQCPAGRFGYPCFRDGSDPLVVLVTDSPMHNGPLSSSYPYDYSAAALTTTMGTQLDDVEVPNGNDGWGDAFTLSSQTQSMLGTFLGSTSGYAADVPASRASCGAVESAPDAVFRFDVQAPNGAVPITLSTEGSSFLTTLSIHDRIPTEDEHHATADSNERFSNADALGDLAKRALLATGDTTKPSAVGDMSADYQGSLFGTLCGASSSSADAAFAFHVDGASGDVPLSISLDMGNRRPVLAIYEEGVGLLPRWPIHTTELQTSSNDNAHASAFDLPLGGSREYLSVLGDTSALTADYDPNVLGGATCNPAASARDAAFHLQLDGTRTLRFDTEGSTFDTVISLHSQKPSATSGNWITHPAAETHMNMNETTSSAYAVGNMTGRQEIYLGNTAGMASDISDRNACGLDNSMGCGDAVYAIDLDRRTTLRMSVTGTGFTPGLFITRQDPTGVVPTVHALTTGADHTCALSGGQAFCWGSDAVGQLGNGAPVGSDSTTHVQVTGISNAQDIASGVRHTCVALADGSVRCWGEGAGGRLGNGADANQASPVVVSNLGPSQRAVQVALGDQHSCALLNDGRIVCWGANARGQLGNGTTMGSSTPVPVSIGALRFVLVAANGDHTCAIRDSDHSVYCWGQGLYGALGDGIGGGHIAVTPGLVMEDLINAVTLSLGAEHSCAVLSSGRSMCWGRGSNGRLGHGDNSHMAVPTAALTFDGKAKLDNAVASLGAGRQHTCVRTLEGFVLCFGDDSQQQLGNGSGGSSNIPGGVSSLIDVTELVSRADHTCALRKTGAVACWGLNAHGQLGDGSKTTRDVPVLALPGTAPKHVSFGNGEVDLPFSQICSSAAQPAELGCKYGQQSADGHDYSVCATQSRTWHSAGLACQAAGMELVDIDTPGENAYVASKLSGPAWIGVKRATTNNWLDLTDKVDFQNLDNELIWHTDTPYSKTCPLFQSCKTTLTKGHFINDLPTDPAPSDLVDSNPWSPASTWVSGSEPAPTEAKWGQNCVTLSPSGKWSTDVCSAVPKPMKDCGFLGLGCLLEFLVGAVVSLVGGVLGWLSAGLIDITNLVDFSLGGRYSSPHFSGGIERAYVCEQNDDHRDVTLDAGRYYVVVKGINDGVAANSCSGNYALRLEDLNTPTGGYLACDDNGGSDPGSSALQATLGAGDYYVVVKGKNANDAGTYNLTVRDVNAVKTQELSCDVGEGAGSPAQLTLNAKPGHHYYALVKGDSASDEGPYTLTIRDDGIEHSQRLACDASSGPGGSSLITQSLGTGTYYAVLKGRGASESGDYRLTIGGATATTSTFTPPTYAQTKQALNDEGIRVSTVLTCSGGGACSDALGQAQALADDTGGVVQMASSAQEVPQKIVQSIFDVASLDTITARLMYSPDPNPGFINLAGLLTPGATAVVAPGASTGCKSESSTMLSDCGPGAQPSFLVRLQNPLLGSILPGLGALGSYHFTLQMQGTRDGEMEYVQNMPVYVVPQGGVPPSSFSQGSYTQDIEAKRCEDHNNLAPSWHALSYEADVRPDTKLELFACTANKETDLAACPLGTASASGYQRVITVTAGAGSGTPCTIPTQATDCPNGYCSGEGLCQFSEGASCVDDNDCPGSGAGRCHDGPSSASVGKTCMLQDATGHPASALDSGDLKPFIRIRANLTSLGDGSRTPILYTWEARYRCLSLL